MSQERSEDPKTGKSRLTSVETSTGLPVVSQWEKMSKSKHNGVDPNEMLDKYGCDMTR